MMTTSELIAVASIVLAAFVAMVGLLGWIARILMSIQTELARLSSEVRNMTHRINRVEQRVFNGFDERGMRREA